MVVEAFGSALPNLPRELSTDIELTLGLHQVTWITYLSLYIYRSSECAPVMILKNGGT